MDGVEHRTTLIKDATPVWRVPGVMRIVVGLTILVGECLEIVKNVNDVEARIGIGFEQPK